jgi:hypothetical protein
VRRFLLLSLAVFACQRPIAGRDISSTILGDLIVEPSAIKSGVPLQITFRASGVAPSEVTIELGNRRETCTPIREGTRYKCTAAPVTRAEFTPGPTLLLVRAADESGRTSVITENVTIDFDCPRFVALSVVPAIAQPGDTVVVSIETSESLFEPPVVTHGGRPWETAAGNGQTFAVTHLITLADPQTLMPLTVRLVDLAGNTSGDCNGDGMLEFAVDHSVPAIDAALVQILRDAPGVPTRIRAQAGAFRDDVGIAEVRVTDEQGTLIARLDTDPDGSIPETSLGAQPTSRLLLQAIDRFARTSALVTVPETWRLSIGEGSTPNSALRTASRYSGAPPRSRSMDNRTIEGAPDVQQADARAITVRTRITFEKVGDLPSRYEDVNHIMAGYEPVGRSVIAVGGYRGREFGFFANYVDDTSFLTWDETERRYVHEQGPPLVKSEGREFDQVALSTVPGPRYGYNMAFDGRGCGVAFSGDVLYNRPEFGDQSASLIGDVWQLCWTPGGYRWTFIPTPFNIDGGYVGRLAPIVWDEANQRYVTAGGSDDLPVLFLEPGADPASWRWVNVQQLPSGYVSRYGSLLFYDPRLPGFSTGLGFSQVGNGEHRHMWSYTNGQWQLATVPVELGYRSFAATAFDDARGQLVMWGGNEGYQDEPPDPLVWFMTGTATTGPGAWRSAALDTPLPRFWPSVVYDSDRQVTLVFGGVRHEGDPRFVPPEVHQLIAQPSSPFLQASIDLAAPRPKGIVSLRLRLRASGAGDADALGAGAVQSGGVVVKMWDHEIERWIDVATIAHPLTQMTEIPIVINSDAERFVSLDGVVPLTLTSLYPATEAVAARLDVDLIDGTLDLRSGISLP